MSTKEVEEGMIVLNPPLTINQAWNYSTNTMLVKYNDILNGKVKAQKSTTRWTGIEVYQRYRWNMQIENEVQFLRSNTTGNLLNGSNFGEVFKYFVLGGDETCCKDLDGHVHVIRKKYKIKVP